MRVSTRTAALAGAAVTFAATTVLTGGVASAYIPGADNDGVVVITDSDLVQVAVNPKAPNAVQVTGSITNTGARPLRCGVPSADSAAADGPGQVTEAEVVTRSMDFYRTHVFEPGGFVVPMGGGVVTAGSLYNVLPTTGSLTGSLLGDSGAEMVQIREMQKNARVAGHTGDPVVGTAAAFTLNAGQTSNWTANLAAPATGDRGDWQAAAMFFCRHTTAPVENFVFAGYEPTTPPEEP